jgi:hypothetical protein
MFAPFAGIDPWNVWAAFKRFLTMRRPAYVAYVNSVDDVDEMGL